VPAFGVTPYGALQLQDFHTPAYSETGGGAGGFGLSYAAANATDVRTELGSRFDAPTIVAGRPLILYGRLAWAHDFVDTPSLNASFVALPGSSFTVNGAPIAANSALTTIGAQVFFTPNWSPLGKFDGEFASNSQTYAGSGTLRYTW
jgi:outer membrane autotransporter protein